MLEEVGSFRGFYRLLRVCRLVSIWSLGSFERTEEILGGRRRRRLSTEGRVGRKAPKASKAKRERSYLSSLSLSSQQHKRRMAFGA